MSIQTRPWRVVCAYPAHRAGQADRSLFRRGQAVDCYPVFIRGECAAGKTRAGAKTNALPLCARPNIPALHTGKTSRAHFLFRRYKQPAARSIARKRASEAAGSLILLYYFSMPRRFSAGVASAGAVQCACSIAKSRCVTLTL